MSKLVKYRNKATGVTRETSAEAADNLMAKWPGFFELVPEPAAEPAETANRRKPKPAPRQTLEEITEWLDENPTEQRSADEADSDTLLD